MFDFTQISHYRENNRLEAKLATGGLPHSIWETYSAFANTYGGVILLGVEELPDHSLRVQGLLDPQGMVEEFIAGLDDPAVVSVNLLREEDIQILHVDGGDIVAITVPMAERDQLPVYIGSNLRRGGYRRSGDGAYHCTQAELNAMLSGRTHRAQVEGKQPLQPEVYVKKPKRNRKLVLVALGFCYAGATLRGG